MKRALLLACAVVLFAQAEGQSGDKAKEKKVRMIVKAPVGTAPTTLSGALKGGKGITKVEIASDGTNVDLEDITSGSGERPKPGTFSHQKMTVYKGKSFKAYDIWVAPALPKGSLLKNFSYQGTFNGRFGTAKHKFAYFEATAYQP
jgi:hypothetical protein